MSLRYLRIMLISLVLVFLSQGCFPPPPPFYYDRDDHHHHRYRHGYSSQQSPKPVAQLIIRNGEKLSNQEEVAQ